MNFTRPVAFWIAVLTAVVVAVVLLREVLRISSLPQKADIDRLVHAVARHRHESRALRFVLVCL
jgi:hypothetical protein